MSDLVEWLTAQLDVDEQIARAASLAPWVAEPGSMGRQSNGDPWPSLYVAPATRVPRFRVHAEPDAEHIALHDPARVLADIAAKRRIVAREIAVDRVKRGAPPYSGPLNDINADEPTRHPLLIAYLEEWGEQVRDTPTLRDLASVYADRPGYREEWKP